MADLDNSVVYFNTRVAGMRGQLFPASEVLAMLDQGDLTQMTDQLLESEYRQEMAEALARYTAADAIEDAVSRNLGATFQVLQSRAQGDYRELVRFFLARWDLTAAKSLLRLRHHGLTADGSTLPLVVGPTLSQAALHEMAGLESMEALVAALVSWNPSLGAPLRRALPAYRESNDLAQLEEALDRAYYVAGLKRFQGSTDPNVVTLREQLASEIDRINLRLVFQSIGSKSGGGELESRLLPGGWLGRSVLVAMLNTGDVSGAVGLLGSTRYSSLVDELFQVLQTGRFSPIERMLDRLLMRQMRRFARRDGFGIGVLMDYVWQKYNECINLRLVARGLAGNLPVGRVRDELHFA
jgi:vacuolar-type H+-ATPase subunit C/Vma6